MPKLAVPVPAPISVAINLVPTLLSALPIAIKSVFPAVTIVYSCPTTKFPAGYSIYSTF